MLARADWKNCARNGNLVNATELRAEQVRRGSISARPIATRRSSSIVRHVDALGRLSDDDRSTAVSQVRCGSRTTVGCRSQDRSSSPDGDRVAVCLKVDQLECTSAALRPRRRSDNERQWHFGADGPPRREVWHAARSDRDHRWLLRPRAVVYASCCQDDPVPRRSCRSTAELRRRRRGPRMTSWWPTFVGCSRRPANSVVMACTSYRKVLNEACRVEGRRSLEGAGAAVDAGSTTSRPRMRAGHAHGPKAHDGTITTEAFDVMWGT